MKFRGFQIRLVQNVCSISQYQQGSIEQGMDTCILFTIYISQYMIRHVDSKKFAIASATAVYLL